MKNENNDINNYGIVYTPDNFVDEILNLIPDKYFKNKQLKWLDIVPVKVLLV